MVDNTVEQLGLESMGVAVEILFVGVLKLEITLGVFPATPISITCMWNTLVIRELIYRWATIIVASLSGLAGRKTTMASESGFNTLNNDGTELNWILRFIEMKPQLHYNVEVN